MRTVADAVPAGLTWAPGQTFFVGVALRGAATGPAPADPGGSAWSDEVVWRVDVSVPRMEEGGAAGLLSGLRVGAGAPVTVLRARAGDAVVTLVFHEQTLVGVTTNGPGGRAWSSGDTANTPLSRTLVAGFPTYLAPPDRAGGTGEIALRDAVDGTRVGLVYAAGAPWPITTESANVRTRLIAGDAPEAWAFGDASGSSDSADFSASADFFASAALSAPADFSASVDADEALRLGLPGKTHFAVAPEDAPWAGAWWPMRSAALVFGYGGRPTLSDALRPRVEPLQRDLDAAYAHLRTLPPGPAHDAAKAAYDADAAALEAVVVAFYDALLAGLDAGDSTLAHGILTLKGGGTYGVDTLSPFDKFAVLLWARGERDPNPFYVSGWEILHHYHPDGADWWGHCNGWSSAAILTNEPRADVVVPLGLDDAGSVRYTPADIKGLLTEAHAASWSRTYGVRYDGPADALEDLSPATFHRVLNLYVRGAQAPIVFDTAADEAVWNYPVTAVDLEIVPLAGTGGSGPPGGAVEGGVGEADAADPEDADSGDGDGAEDGAEDGAGDGDGAEDDGEGGDGGEFAVTARVTFATDAVPETWVDVGSPATLTREWRYTLVTDGEGRIRGGSWADDADHPDFAWVPYDNPVGRAQGGGENPYLRYGTLLDVLGEGVRREGAPD